MKLFNCIWKGLFATVIVITHAGASSHFTSPDGGMVGVPGKSVASTFALPRRTPPEGSKSPQLKLEVLRRLQRLPSLKDPRLLQERGREEEQQREKIEAAKKSFFKKVLDKSALSEKANRSIVSSGITTFVQLRTANVQKVLSKLQKTDRRKLVTASRLSLLSSDPKVVSALIHHKITLTDLRKLSNKEIAEKTQGEIPAPRAELLRKKARILRDVIEVRQRTLRVLERNPTPVYAPSGVAARQFMRTRQETGAIEACGPHDNVFSPATYLIHLLDFIPKWLDISLQELDTVILMQRIEDLPVALDAGDEVRYITLSNRILENVIAKWTSPARAFPNEHISWGWKELHLPLDDAGKNQIRVDIYDDFKSATYQDEPGFIPNVMVQLFDSYVREFGTTRREVRFASNSGSLKDQFKKKLELIDADLQAIDVTDDNISLASVETLSKQLLEFYKRKEEKTVRQQYIQAYAESRGKEFIPVFRERLEVEIDKLLEALLQGNLDGTTGEALDAVLLKKQSDAATCIRSGEQCPDGYSALLPVKELFRHFASSYPDYDSSVTPTSDEFADWKYQQLIAQLKAQRLEELLEEHGNGSLPAETRQQLEAQAAVDAGKAVTTEAVFERQLSLLGKSHLERELQSQGSEHRFYVELKRKAEDKWRTAVSRAETGYLQKIRKNLIVLALHKLIEHPESDAFSYKTINGKQIAFHAKNLDLLQDALLFDLTAVESHRTTALAFGIMRLHALVHALRIGKPERRHMDEVLARTWGWARSYGTWHAAKMVAAYPENFLIPEIRRDVTHDFKVATKPIAEAVPDNLEEIFSSYHERIAEFVDIEIDAVVPVGERLFLFAHNDDSIKYSVLNPRGTWSGWRTIKALAPHRMLVRPSGPDIPDPSKEQYHVAFKRNSANGRITIYLFRKIATLLTNEQREELGTAHYLMATWNYAAFRPDGDKLVNLAEQTNEGEGDDEEELTAAWLPIEGSGNSVPRHPNTRWLYIAKTTDGFSLRLPYWRSDLNQTIFFRVDIAFRKDGTPYYKDRDHERTGFLTFAQALADPSGEVIFWHQFGGHYACASSDGSECGGRVQHPEGPDDAIYYEDWRTGEKKYLWWRYPGIRGFTAAAAPNGDALLSYYKSYNDHNALSVIRFRNVGGDLQVVSGGGVYAHVLPSLLYDRLAVSSGRIFVLGHRIFEDFQGDPFPSTEIIYARSDFLETEALRLSFHSSGQGGGGAFPLNPYYYQQLTKPSDPIRIYLDEYLLHLPIWIAELLNREGRYAEAIKVLQRVARDPLSPSCAMLADACFPGFSESSLNAPTIESWLVEPFNPYSLVNLDKPRYKVAWLIAYVQNVIDWADRLFAIDSPETVNLAREKYEYAGAILGLPYWAIQDEERIQTSSTMTIGELYGQTTSSEELLPDQLVLLGMTPETVNVLGEVTIHEDIPDLAPRCLPANPRLAVLQWHIESNLSKISRNQNIAGIERDLQLYATPVDPSKLVRQAAAGQLEFEEAVPSTPPPIYRFSFLVDRAKYLVGVAQQFESSMLAALKEGEEAEYTELQARQDLAIQHGNVVLQQLMVQEANDQVRLSEAQKERAVFSQGHFQDLLIDGLNSYEAMALLTLGISIAFPSSITVTAGVPPSGSVSYSPSGILQTMSSIASMQASYERRADEWRYQSDLAGFDISVAQVGIDIANSHVEITAQEEAQARLSYDFAKDNVEFLVSRFGNAELYRWMRGQLRRLYRSQLNMAFATARSAQKALEFERQTSVDFIGFEYWNEAREGLLGAERLLSDIAKLEQFRISTAQRKKEIETTFSLASVTPEELQRLRDTGVMEFRTLKAWFDRQFPGHYLRLIKNVSVTTFALVPPNEGIHATLSNPGVSYAMAREPFDQMSTIYRLPESVALSSAGNATGLFELRLDDQMLLPFEGSGVDTSWRLEMPKGANRFDYSTIADVLFTVRYTALEDRSYREKVLLEMGMDESGYVDVDSRRGFSIHNSFSYQWYLFFNPTDDIGLSSRKLEFKLNGDDFPPNEQARKIKRVTLMLQLADDASLNDQALMPVRLAFSSEARVETSDLLPIRSDQLAQSTDKMRGKVPYGEWTFQFQLQPDSPVTADWLEKNLEDIVIVVDYKAKVHYNR